jgi:hypothetical protein
MKGLLLTTALVSALLTLASMWSLLMVDDSNTSTLVIFSICPVIAVFSYAGSHKFK